MKTEGFGKSGIAALQLPAPHRLFGPDLIRATAITSVMLAHTIPGLSTFALIGPMRGVLGFIGVETFFVLSGYLIGGILLKQMFDGSLDSASGLASFWKRRWFRTLPNYYLFLILFLILGRCIDGALPAGYWRFFWFGQALMNSHPKFFTVAWSLAVEEWFYFSFPLLLWLIMKAVKGRLVSFWITVAVFLIFPPVLRAFARPENAADGLIKVTFFRLDSIMFGVILAFLHKRQPKYWSSLRCAWPVGAAVVVGLSCLMGTCDGMEFSFFWRVLFFSIFSLGLSLIFPRVVELLASTRRRAYFARAENQHLVILDVFESYLAYTVLCRSFLFCWLVRPWSQCGGDFFPRLDCNAGNLSPGLLVL